ncbi:MAG: hypothetical protein LBL43_03620 [Treponema sp.]|jgi:uroporphyrinogen decarboxylase|nr:hypothetical protein [Treponema sp.]
MTHKERVLGALKGEALDRLPVSAWMHFPREDKTAEGMVNAFTRFQTAYDWDIAKLMYRNSFPYEDLGVKSGDEMPDYGWYRRVSQAVLKPSDWNTLKVLDPKKGALAEMVGVTKIVSQKMGPSIMKLATVFTPLMVAHQIAGTERLQEDMKSSPKNVHQGLEAITQGVIDFTLACLDAGADGIFFATGEANKGFCAPKEYGEFGHPYNKRVLEAVRDKAEMIMMHICGQDIYFEEFADYPVDALNWDDRNTAPSLKEARKLTGKCLMGGVDMRQTLFKGSAAEVETQIRASVEAAGKRKLIITPGCGIPCKCPPENLKAMVRAASGIKAD